MLFSLPQWLENVKHIPPAQTGLLLFPMSLASASAALIVSGRESLLLKNLLALISITAACIAIFFLHEQTPFVLVISITMLMGLATGINPIANQASLYATAPQGQTGLSFGLYRTFGYLGAIISGSQMKTTFRTGVTDNNFHTMTIFAGACCILLVVLTLRKTAFSR